MEFRNQIWGQGGLLGQRIVPGTGAVECGPGGLRSGVLGRQGALWVWGWGEVRCGGGLGSWVTRAGGAVSGVTLSCGDRHWCAVWVCLGRWVYVFVRMRVRGGLGFCFTCWRRCGLCVHCVGVFFIRLLLPRCCPPRHRYPCVTASPHRQ